MLEPDDTAEFRIYSNGTSGASVLYMSRFMVDRFAKKMEDNGWAKCAEHWYKVSRVLTVLEAKA